MSVNSGFAMSPDDGKEGAKGLVHAFRSGNSLAISGSRITMLVPSAYFLAYFPLSPLEKSYSSLISSSLLLCLHLVFDYRFPAKVYECFD